MLKLKELLLSAKNYIVSNKILISIISIILVLSIASISVISINLSKKEKNEGESSQVSIDTIVETESEQSSVVEESSSVEEIVSSEVSSLVVSSKPVQSKPTQSVVNNTTNKTDFNKTYKYNTNLDIEDNVFIDALEYTGYNLDKHRKDGNMWKYILSKQKRGLGYLSNIGYGGGSSGYEIENGLPNIKAFQKGGLVCASFVTYIYFNYLPNVAGIDTSSLTKPERSYNANCWYVAAKDWINKGYSKSIPFTASGRIGDFMKFKSEWDIPIGSLVIFCDARNKSNYGSHATVYAGYKNGYNWIFQVGTSNGPEFCAIERMLFGPDPQWPLLVASTPSNIRMSALLEVSVKDEKGNPVPNSSIVVKSSSETIDFGKTGVDGIVKKEHMKYGKYSVNVILPNEYEADTKEYRIELTPKNNSYNKLVITAKEIQKIPQEESEQSQTDSSVSSDIMSDIVEE